MINEIKRQNLVRLLKEKKLTQERLAKLLDVSPSFISALKHGRQNIGGNVLIDLCRALDVDENEFYKGLGFDVPEKIKFPIPVISWVHAGLFTESIDMWPVGISGEAESVYSTKHISEFSFALRVEGDSMEPRFMNGDIIVVDPTQSCDNGCPCIVWINGEVSFKIIRETDESIRLCPMNDKYEERVIRKESKVDFKIIGKVVDLIAKF